MSVISGLVGGLLVKIGLKYAFKWKAAARLASKIGKLVGDIADVVKNWGKVADEVSDAKKGAAAADDAKGAVRAAEGCNSFSGSTKVLMADGSTKPISKIKPGDKVRAKDPETGEKGVRTVTHTWAHTDTLVILKTSAGKITTTEDHAFWNHTDKRWQETQDIDPGDKLLTADGRLVTVLELAWQTRHTNFAYNLTVNDIHTYYAVTGNTPVLVHNCGPDDIVNVYRAPQRGNGADELANGLDPSRHSGGNRTAYVGTEDVARKFADYSVGTYEDGYIRFAIRRGDLDSIAPRKLYEGGPGSEWEIPLDKIEEFNVKTLSREWVDMPW